MMIIIIIIIIIIMIWEGEVESKLFRSDCRDVKRSFGLAGEKKKGIALGSRDSRNGSNSP